MLEAGKLLQNRYKIQDRLGQGGMGSVYRAWDTRLQVPVAIKELTAQPDYDADQIRSLREQFSQEASVLAHLNHQNLVKVTDFFEEDSSDYLVMNFVEGESLSDRIKRDGAIPEDEALRLSAFILDALAYCHSHGVIHRDIKPANIIIRPDGQPVLVDFGLVKLWNPDDPRTKTAVRGVGTPQYAPPEQYELTTGHTEPRSDIYSFGATLYHALTGQTPPTATLRIAAPEEFASVKAFSNKVSTRTANAVERAMTLARSKRWANVSDMAKALGITIRNWQQTSQTDTSANTVPQAPTVKLTRMEPTSQTEPKKRKNIWIFGLVLGLILVTAAVLLLTGRLSFISRLASSADEASATPEAVIMAPTATATASPTVTPTVTPTTEPTSTSTPTPKPTATLTLTPTPTETLEPTPTEDSVAVTEAPTATAVATNTPEATPIIVVPTATVQPATSGDIGRIVFTVGSGSNQYLYSADPTWSIIEEIGRTDGTRNTCNGNAAAATIDGRVIPLYTRARCELAESVVSCTSPNGNYKIIANFQAGWTYNVLLENTQTNTQEFIYGGSLNRIVGIQWSADSRWAIFGVDGIVNVITAGAPGYQSVFSGFDQTWAPEFSPDSSMVLFTRPVGANLDIYIARPDGSGEQNVTNAATVFKICPRWRQ